MLLLHIFLLQTSAGSALLLGYFFKGGHKAYWSLLVVIWSPPPVPPWSPVRLIFCSIFKSGEDSALGVLRSRIHVLTTIVDRWIVMKRRGLVLLIIWTIGHAWFVVLPFTACSVLIWMISELILSLPVKFGQMQRPTSHNLRRRIENWAENSRSWTGLVRILRPKKIRSKWRTGLLSSFHSPPRLSLVRTPLPWVCVWVSL